MFALADVNYFYASCEKVFRPDLRSKAVVVLKYNDDCVIARSQEAAGYKNGGTLVSATSNAICQTGYQLFQQLRALREYEQQNDVSS